MIVHMLHVFLLQALAIEAHKDLRPVLLPVGGLPEMTIRPMSQQPRGLVEHEQRDNTNTTVNWATMPTCGDFPGCAGVNGNASSYAAGLEFALPCPAVAGTCSSDETVYSCLTYSLECYCNLPLQLNCSWFDCENWLDWMSVEDWFQQQCPSVQPVNFTQIPSCASQCVQDAAFYAGCITSGRNCFCNQESFFGCGDDCNDSDMNATYSWYAQECEVTFDDAELIVNGNKSNVKGTLETSTHNTTIRWYEGIAIATAGLSFVLLVMGWILNPIMRHKIRRRNEKTHAE